METPEQEAARVRAEVVEEMEAEESGSAPVVDEPAPTEKKDDPWEGVPPALKQQFDTMSARVETLAAVETRLKQAESRIGAVTNELSAAKKAVEVAKAMPSAAQVAAAAESDEKWEALKKDFPEWADAFDGRFDKKLNIKIEELRGELKSSAVAVAPAEDLDKRLLTLVKPKWKQTVASQEWKEWLAAQPQESRNLVFSERAEDAVTLITAFEEASKPQKTATEIAAERKERLKKAELPVGGKATPIKSEADMSTAELRANIGKEIFAE